MPFSRDTPATRVQDEADAWGCLILHHRAQLCEALKYHPRSSWDFSQSVSWQSLTAKELREGGRAKPGPNLITCCVPLTAAHCLKPLVRDSPVEDGWRTRGIISQSTERQGRSDAETRGCKVCHSRLQGPEMNSFIVSTMCMLPQKGESPFTALGLTDSQLKASGLCLLCKSS